MPMTAFIIYIIPTNFLPRIQDELEAQICFTDRKVRIMLVTNTVPYMYMEVPDYF
jgi:hypothetical protein